MQQQFNKNYDDNDENIKKFKKKLKLLNVVDLFTK